MNKKWIIGSALVASLAVPAALRAHEGHAHKVMGTVTMRHENHLEVKDKNGKTVILTIDDKTKILRGKGKGTRADIKAGQRIVVTYVSQDKVFVAREVRLAAKATAGTK